MSVAIKAEGLGKRYRLGVINRSMLYDDLQKGWARLSGRSHLATKLDQAGRPIEPSTTRGGELWALKDVSFEVQAGDVLGVIGKNGSGKSTLLKILSRITSPTTGQAVVHGRLASLLEVGTGFHPELTGRENVFLNGSILGMKATEIKSKLDEIVDFSGVEKFLDTPVKRYSSGMQVRLAFAVASHLDPDILLIDEVLAVGDAAFQQKCVAKISSAAREGRTVFFVSHQSGAVESLCRRGIVLDKGQLVFSGTQTEALSYYGQQLNTADSHMEGRTDRKGNGDVRVDEISVLTETGEIAGSLISGKAYDVRFHLNRKVARHYQNYALEFTIATMFDVPILAQNNTWTGQMVTELKDSGEFVCRIPRLPLVPGSYRISYTLKADMNFVLLDALDNALEVVVEGSDFFGAGIVPSNPKGNVFMDAKWQIDSHAAPAANSLPVIP